MPTYDYECRSCHHTFEAFQSIKEEPLKKCPKCGKSVRRLFGGGLGIIFKGSGFYTTDNKRSSAVTGGNGSSRAQSKGEPKAEPKGEPKAETKTSGEKTESAGKK
jgi:putative FmdB family regulatory protein